MDWGWSYHGWVEELDVEYRRMVAGESRPGGVLCDCWKRSGPICEACRAREAEVRRVDERFRRRG